MVDSQGDDLIKLFATYYAAKQNWPYSYALPILRRKISLAIRLGVARQLLAGLKCTNTVNASLNSSPIQQESYLVPDDNLDILHTLSHPPCNTIDLAE
jgi:hypothetical protein